MTSAVPVPQQAQADPVPQLVRADPVPQLVRADRVRVLRVPERPVPQVQAAHAPRRG
jgi:hypothetical protein